MVSYQRLTSIAFDVARRKGAKFTGSPPTNSARIVEIVAEEWQSDKERYKQMTEKQARRALEDTIQVSKS